MRKAFCGARPAVVALLFIVVTGTHASAAEPKKGFSFESEDGRFSLRLGSRLQFRYTYDNPEAGVETSSFTVRRAKMIAEGHAHAPWLTYKIQFEAVGTPRLDDYYLDVVYFPSASLKFGQFKVPFSRQRQTSTGKFQFLERSLATDEFQQDRDQGIELHGNVGRSFFSYHLAVFNGNGPNTSANENGGHLYVARAEINPLGAFGYEEPDVGWSETPKVALGGGYALNERKTVLVAGKPVNEDILSESIDLAAKYRGFSIVGEYFSKRETPEPSSMKKVDKEGFYTQAGYFVLPRRLEVAGRYSVVNPDKDVEHDLTQEISGAVSYFFAGHDLKVQADYSRLLTEAASGDLQENRARVQFQLVF